MQGNVAAAALQVTDYEIVYPDHLSLKYISILTIHSCVINSSRASFCERGKGVHAYMAHEDLFKVP